MTKLSQRFQWPILIVMFLAGSAFLLKMCYLSLAFNTVFGIVFLLAFYGFARARFDLVVPPVLLLLVLAGLEVDAVGNYFRMYGNQFGPLQYDEFAHLSIQVLVTPLIVWLTSAALEKFGQRLSLGFTICFAGVTIFALSAFYEIIELWDEVFFNGHRIWSTHDTANDLQFDLCGIVLGALLAFTLLKHRVRGADPTPTQLPTPV
jgi:uncharacterized membrane protein YjdF